MARSDLKEKILELRSKGMSHRKIAEQLGCAKSTVAYHCSPTTKETAKAFKEKSKEENPGLYYFKRRLNEFKRREPNSNSAPKCLD